MASKRPGFDDRKRAIDEQTEHRKKDYQRSGMRPDDAERRARREMNETIRRLEQERDW